MKEFIWKIFILRYKLGHKILSSLGISIDCCGVKTWNKYKWCSKNNAGYYLWK